MFFIDDLLFAPITGFQFIMRTLQRVAEEQWTDDAPLKERLLELQMKLETGEITEDEYAAEETQILTELRDVQNRKMELAGASTEQGPGRGPMDASSAKFVIEAPPQGYDHDPDR
jgi:Gas vesicle protein G